MKPFIDVETIDVDTFLVVQITVLFGMPILMFRCCPNYWNVGNLQTLSKG